MLSFDIPSLLTFVLTACALIFGSLFVVKKAASRYFVVDASFEAGERYESRRRMSIGGAGGEDGSGGGEGDAVCAACGKRGTNRCSRCKRVRYCSQTCQSKHWEADHKLKCKQARPLDKIEIVRSGEDSSSRRGSSKLSSISLVPARGTSKVLQEPKKILFPYDNFLKFFNWDKPGFPPCGLLNCGNSCFANVVLQCLTCTRPLAAYLLEGDHARQCIRKQEGWCFLCELQSHIRRASESRQPFSPINILSRIPSIGGNLSRGSQEDAHEFMRFAIDSMQSACLDEHGGEKALDSSTQETTLIQHVFGGHLQSQVVCTKCHMISSRYENMMDLTVEIHGVAESLEECLDQFTGTELLDGQNKYKCDGCNDYVKAHKRLRVHQAPNILTIALKRYQGGIFGKLNQRVTFPEELDLTPYMSTGGDGTDVYFLYAVVVHQDMLNASFFGHYICYTKDYHGRWYRIDDCKVVLVDAEEVHSQGAYMLLYSRRTPRKEPFVKSEESGKKKYSASTDMDSSNNSNTESMNPDARSLSSNTDSQSNLPLPRDTGYERQMDTETDAVKGEDHNMPGVFAELNSTVLQKDPQSIDLADSELSSLGPKNTEEVSTVSLIGTSVSIGTPPSSEAQTMEYEESYGIQIEDNGLTYASGGVPNQSGYASDSSLSSSNTGSNIIHDDVAHLSPIASCGSSSSMDLKTPNNPELKSDAVVAVHQAGSANEVQQPAILSAKNGRPTALISGSKEKPKALFSRGFLDRPAADKRLERGKRVETQKTEGTASMVDGRPNGHANSVHEASKKGPSSSDDSGFLMRPYAQSNKKISTMMMNGNTCDKDNGYNGYKIDADKDNGYNGYRIDAISKSDHGKGSNGEPLGFGEQNGSTSKFVEGQSSGSE